MSLQQTIQNAAENMPTSAFQQTPLSVIILTHPDPVDAISLTDVRAMITDGGGLEKWEMSAVTATTPRKMAEMLREMAKLLEPSGDNGYPADKTLASFNSEEVEGAKIKVEMQVCWMHGRWSNEIYVYVSQDVRDEDVERLAINAMQKKYNTMGQEVSSIHVYHIDEEPFEDDEEEETDD